MVYVGPQFCSRAPGDVADYVVPSIVPRQTADTTTDANAKAVQAAAEATAEPDAASHQQPQWTVRLLPGFLSTASFFCVAF